MPIQWMNSLSRHERLNRFNPITAFIHVPKTAGSTVNSYLQQSGTAGVAHVEALFKQPDKVKSAIARYRWVSGHVTFPKMRATLSKASRRKVRYFTAIRSPDKQIMSHLNWLIEIYHKGGKFYDNHPPAVKRISERIRTSDTSDPRVIVELLNSAQGLFLNCQSRFVLGPDRGNLSHDEMAQRLEVYEMIGTEGTLPLLIERISGIEYQDSERKNVSPYHFPAEVFRDSFVVDYLRERNAADEALYEYVKSNDC
ncbi:hypothetical protein [uncultured Aliiroseovarius sp.]|uniref:hypothetical protein n=1 Tax=uncultured Aliiroseovarius sp. TaxID=1658783 RepID=UPI0025927F71|nr:hypothetical protein [uncultured Aliiroseovarius sp.]